MYDTNQIRAIIIDDSAQARKLLRLMLQELTPEVYIEAEAESADEGFERIKELNLDAVFLDIEMPGKSGLQLAEMLRDIHYTGKIVFTTAYNAYAIQAFRLSAIDYLLKPIQEQQLEEAVQKLLRDKSITENAKRLEVLSENLKSNERQVLCIPSHQGHEYLDINDISYLEAEGSYVKIVCTNGKEKLVTKNLKYFEHALESIPKFVRTHRSYLINLNEVIAYNKSDGGFLSLSNGTQIPISRERKKTIQELLQ